MTKDEFFCKTCDAWVESEITRFVMGDINNTIELKCNSCKNTRVMYP